LCETIFIEDLNLSQNEAPKAHYFCFLLLVQHSADEQKPTTLTNTKCFFYCKTHVVHTIAVSFLVVNISVTVVAWKWHHM